MDKATILAELTKTGEINVFRRSANWEKAFKMYNDIHKTRRNLNCGSCFRDVKGWLQS